RVIRAGDARGLHDRRVVAPVGEPLRRGLERLVVAFGVEDYPVRNLRLGEHGQPLRQQVLLGGGHGPGRLDRDQELAAGRRELRHLRRWLRRERAVPQVDLLERRGQRHANVAVIDIRGVEVALYAVACRVERGAGERRRGGGLGGAPRRQ